MSLPSRRTGAGCKPPGDPTRTYELLPPSVGSKNLDTDRRLPTQVVHSHVMPAFLRVRYCTEAYFSSASCLQPKRYTLCSQCLHSSKTGFFVCWDIFFRIDRLVIGTSLQMFTETVNSLQVYSGFILVDGIMFSQVFSAAYFFVAGHSNSFIIKHDPRRVALVECTIVGHLVAPRVSRREQATHEIADLQFFRLLDHHFLPSFFRFKKISLDFCRNVVKRLATFGPFSAVPAPISARKYAFCSRFTKPSS